MNIIEHLTKTITPIVLSGNDDDSGNKKSLLEHIYAILVARFADKDFYSTLADVEVKDDDESFFERLLPDSENRTKMVEELSKEHHVSVQDTQSLITHSSPLVLRELRGLAGTSSVPSFLSNNLSSVTSILPKWAYALVPAGILSVLNLNVGDALKNAGETVTDTLKDAGEGAKKVAENVTSSVTSTVSNVAEEGGGLMKTLLPIIGLLILAALAWAMLKSCNSKPAPVATPPAITASAPASTTASATPSVGLLAPTLKFSTGADGKLLDGGLGNVGNDELKGKITSALTGVFGEGADKAVNVAVNPTHDINLPFADKLPEIFALLKGVPNATLNFADGHIMVSAPDAKVADKLVADIKALVPNVPVMLESEHGHGHGHSHEHGHDHSHASTTTPTPASVASPTSTTETETKVISSSEPSVFFENGHLKFYFATGKADVAKNSLDHAKEILEAAKQGKKLGISGYTDSTGNAEANAKLSKRRAEAVKAFLVTNGVPETQLELIKPKDSVGATGKDQEGRRVEVYILDTATMTETASTPASSAQ